MRSAPSWQACGSGLLPLLQFTVPVLPETKTTTGESSESILPSQLLSCTRPTVGVAQMSVRLGNWVAVGPQVHFALAVSGPPGGGWYSHWAMHVPPSAVVPASPAQVGGSGRHRPSAGSGSLQPASRPASPAPASALPRDGSQYSLGAQ